MKSFLLAILSMALFSCEPAENNDYSSEIRPAIEATLVELVGANATFEVKSINATENAVLCLLATEPGPSAKDVLKHGQKMQPGKVTVTCDNPESPYVAYFAAKDAKNKYSNVFSIKFNSPAIPKDGLYPWEKNRQQGGFKKGPGKSDRFDPYDNMLLIYGGNVWRSPKKWNQDRMASQITYVDEKGQEHWLFDAFLILEIWDRLDDASHSAALGTEYGADSADKVHWTHFIDYWFEKGYGFDALDKAVGAAKARIGEPKTTRKVIVSIPDPIIYKNWNDETSGSKYWGSINGHELDFSVAEDRVAACVWFVDEVRARWAQAKFENLELYGFYCFSEELATPEQGWNYQYKKWDQVYPAVSDYVHGCNETMSWIPYNWAAGFDRWNKFHFDFVMMQPNHEWHPEYSMLDWKKRIQDNNLSMEFEMDEHALQGSEDWESYRSRFLDYITMCKDLDLYKKTVLSYYMDGDGMYKLAHSKAEKDVELYHIFCQFVLGNIQH